MVDFLKRGGYDSPAIKDRQKQTQLVPKFKTIWRSVFVVLFLNYLIKEQAPLKDFISHHCIIGLKQMGDFQKDKEALYDQPDHKIPVFLQLDEAKWKCVFVCVGTMPGIRRVHS